MTPSRFFQRDQTDPCGGQLDSKGHLKIRKIECVSGCRPLPAAVSRQNENEDPGHHFFPFMGLRETRVFILDRPFANTYLGGPFPKISGNDLKNSGQASADSADTRRPRAAGRCRIMPMVAGSSSVGRVVLTQFSIFFRELWNLTVSKRGLAPVQMTWWRQHDSKSRDFSERRSKNFWAVVVF